MENFEPSNEQIDALNAAMDRNTRLVLCNGSVDFFEQMTKATPTGWPNISGDEFLSVLAGSINKWLRPRHNSWQLKKLLTDLLTDSALSKDRLPFSGIGTKDVTKAAKISKKLKMRVHTLMSDEFTSYFLCLTRQDCFGAMNGRVVIQGIADSVWVMGSKRGTGEAYAQTLAFNLLDLA